MLGGSLERGAGPGPGREGGRSHPTESLPRPWRSCRWVWCSGCGNDTHPPLNCLSPSRPIEVPLHILPLPPWLPPKSSIASALSCPPRNSTLIILCVAPTNAPERPIDTNTLISSLTATRRALQCSRPNLADICSHFTRVVRYARPSDYAVGAAHVAAGPALLLLMERVSPSYVGRRGFAPIMRATCFISLAAGFLKLYSRSTCAE